ncbi:MAG: glycosyltransferase [Nitrososphaerota archaeon]|nr:glycosyltransferase [Nitrososphaerota archaeon]
MVSKLTAELSVIIPTKNNEKTIKTLLESIVNQGVQNIETIVIDNFSEDATVRIAEEYGANVLLAGPERCAQRNLGARVATGSTLLFLDSDMELSSGVLVKCLAEIKHIDSLSIREISISNNFWMRSRALERNVAYKTPFLLAARCIRKDVFFEVGGFDESITGIEDFDLQARIVAKGYSHSLIIEPIYHHEEDIGFLAYLKKRKKYSESYHIFKQKHPDQWSQLSSTRSRVRTLSEAIINNAGIKNVFFLLGLVFIRFCEYVVTVGMDISSMRIKK